MRFSRWFGVCCFSRGMFMLLLLCASNSVAAQPYPLFDGKSFEGWEGKTGSVWRIERGEIVAGKPDAKQPENDFLCTNREFGDFELRLKYKRGENNGGVQFRSQRIPNNHEVSGYQADFAPGIDGFLYDESRRNRFLARADADTTKRLGLAEWNTYRIRAQGDHIQLWINDVLTVDYHETDGTLPRRGKIALQIHSGATEVRYKELMIEELTSSVSRQSESTQPNILFLLADDQRFDTLGCTGHPIISTPTIDRLAHNGVRFRQHFVTTSVCWVSRAIVLTGQWARSHADPEAIPRVRAESLATIYPVQLRQAGYRTGFFGKWHLQAPAGFKPAEHYDQYEAIGRNPYIKTLPDGTQRHETDIICDRGIEFIKSQPVGKPFCLNLWFNAAHAEDNDRRPGIGHYPWPPALDGLYDDIPIPPPRLNSPAIYEAHPQFLKESINRQRFFWGYDTPEKYQTNVRAYLRMITGIDRGIARVLAALEEQGLADNTIVVYSADNGYYLGDRGFQGKWSHYEQSLRVPLIIYDPSLPQQQRGRVIDQLTLNVDLPATFLEWAGVTKPAAYEGESLVGLLQQASAPNWRTYFFCEHLDLAPTLTWEGVRTERYKYARYFDQQPIFEFLHDLQQDPDELTNYALESAYAETLLEMRRLCDMEMQRRGGALLPLAERGAKKISKRQAAPKTGAGKRKDSPTTKKKNPT